MISKKKLKERVIEELDKKAKVRIGKNGITSSIISEIDKQLALNELIKIRFLNNFLTENLDNDIAKLAKETKSQLLDKRGKTMLLYRKK
ncbi:MAG: YhbY family RNA-binding protein [Candidatus Heimdallarchaeota archaeon]